MLAPLTLKQEVVGSRLTLFFTIFDYKFCRILSLGKTRMKTQSYPEQMNQDTDTVSVVSNSKANYSDKLFKAYPCKLKFDHLFHIFVHFKLLNGLNFSRTHQICILCFIIFFVDIPVLETVTIYIAHKKNHSM